MYRKGQKANTVQFSVRPKSAKSVAVAGDFNGWKPAPMRRRTDGSYSAELVVSPGRHEYKFIIDNCWVQDPDVHESVPNAYGTLNSTFLVERAKEYAHTY